MVRGDEDSSSASSLISPSSNAQPAPAGVSLPHSATEAARNHAKRAGAVETEKIYNHSAQREVQKPGELRGERRRRSEEIEVFEEYL